MNTTQVPAEPVTTKTATFGTDTVLYATGIARQALHEMLKNQVIDADSGGRGKRAKYEWRHVVAVAASEHYRGLGFDRGFVWAVAKLVSDLGDEVHDHIRAGRTWISPGRWVRRGTKRVHIPGCLVAPPSPDATARVEAELNAPFDFRSVIDLIDKQLQSRTAAEFIAEKDGTKVKKPVTKKSTKKRAKKVVAKK